MSNLLDTKEVGLAGILAGQTSFLDGTFDLHHEAVDALYGCAELRSPEERLKARTLPKQDLSGWCYVSDEELEAIFANLVLSKDPNIKLEDFVKDLVDHLASLDYKQLLAFLEFNPVAPLPAELSGRGDVYQLARFLSCDQDRVNARVELFKRALLERERRQIIELQRILRTDIAELGIEGVDELLAELERQPLNANSYSTRHSSRAETFDLPASSNPENTRLHRAFAAIRNLLAAPEDLSEDELSALRKGTLAFVNAVLNPQIKVRYTNYTDVYGAESNVRCAENDLTRARVDEHLRAIAERYGVEVEVFNQGTSITAPEQCGLFAAVAIEQAAKADRNVPVSPRFVILNNAARSKDGLESKHSLEKSEATPLLYFKFRVAGVIHSGLAYGYQTLSLIRHHIEELYVIQGTENGSQFRSLEIQPHIAVVSALADGELPACYKCKPVEVEDIIPEIELADNEAIYLGCDKFGNGILSKELEELLRGLACDSEVWVSFIDRQTGRQLEGHKPKNYLVQSHLGSKRDGQLALWTSSTPSPTYFPSRSGRCLANIGVFKQERDQINPDVVSAPAGCIVRVEKLGSRS